MKAFAYPIIAVVALASTGASAQTDNLATGRAFFQQRCQMCHTVTPDGRNGVGPNLKGVVNRPVAAADYAYSPALAGYKQRWTGQELDRFLAAPSKVVPGTRMAVGVPDRGQRASVIAYLSSLGK
jgi:cytochrome c